MILVSVLFQPLTTTFCRKYPTNSAQWQKNRIVCISPSHSISVSFESKVNAHTAYDLAGITFRKKLAALCPVINLPFVESHRGTSGWLLEEKTYQDWVKGNERPILYLSGSNGMGKTSTSHFLVETLRSENIVLSFFCTRQAHRRESAKHILLSMVSQFLLHEPHLYSLAQNLLSLKQTSVWTQEDMWAVFRALISQPRSKELVCVVDNLDECGSDRWLMENFLWLYDELDIPFKLIITGKPYCLNKALTSPKHQKKLVELHLEGGSDDKKMRKEIVDDMETSTRNWISDLVRKSPVYRGLEATILEQYRAHFFGKFGASPLALKVSFGLLNPPRAGFSVASLREQLHCLGEDIQLSVLYKNLLEQIPRYDRPWAMNVLRWICYTFRPLTIMELSAAMSIDARSTADKVVKKQLSSKNFSWNIRDDIYRIFGQLVEFKRDQIHLVHHSLHDFLINGAEKHDWYYLEDSAIIHGRIFDVCLTLLIAEKTSGHLNFQSGGYLHQAQLCLASSSDQNDNNFLLYASQYWPRHYQESAKLLPSVNKILDFLNADQIASLWFKVYGYLVGDEEDQYSPLLVAAKLGLPMIADRLIAVAPSSDPGNREAALAVAATYGHECVVEELLFTGARLSEALYRASKMGHVRVVSRLLEAAKNDKVDLAGLNINAGLCAAAANGHSKVVKKLLKSGASVRCPDSKDGLTPLQHAVKNGRGHVVRVLLHPPKARQCRSAKVQDDHDDHDDYDDDNKTLLIERSRHIEFRNSADTNKEQRARILGTKDDTTAEIATPNPDDDTIDQGKVEKVVEGGDSEPETEDEESDDSDDDDMDQKDEGREKEDININFKDSEDVKKRSVFHLAAEGGYLEIINKLPDEYAVNIMAAAGQSTTPLHLAAAGGYLKVVKMLSKRFESWVPYKDEKGCLALHHAVQGGHSLVVDYLLKRDITAAVSTPVDGRQALHIAAKYGHKDIVNSLLTQKELEIAVDATDRDGYTPLQIAVQEGHHDVALSLLTAGADIDKGGPGPITRAPISLFSRFGRYRPKKNKPPLHLAAECGHLELIKLLLDKGASINKTDTQSGWTALHCANRQPACVQMLIDRGAYLEAQNIDGSTPLILAAQEGTTEGVRALLKAGANPTAVNKRTHISALHKAAGSGDWESIKLLLDCGVNPFALAQGSNSGTSFDFALNCRRQDVDGRNLARMMIDWLIPENFWPDPFKLAVASGSHRLLDVWIEYRPDDLEKYDYKDLMTEKGTPLLHLLAASGMHSVIRKIVKVDPESLSRQDSKGRVLQDIVMDSDTQKLLQTLTEQTSNAGNHQTVSAEDNVAVSSDKSTPDSPQSHEADTEYECPKCRKPQPEMVLCWSCKRVMDGEFLNRTSFLSLICSS